MSWGWGTRTSYYLITATSGVYLCLFQQTIIIFSTNNDPEQARDLNIKKQSGDVCHGHTADRNIAVVHNITIDY